MKLLITGAWKCDGNQLKEIESLGHTIVFMQNESDELPCDYKEIEGVIANGLFLYHDIDKFSNLKFIQLTSAGFDRVPMDKVEKRGIKIYNARGVYSIPMAEFALTGVLQIYKKARFFYDNQKQNIWQKNREVMELFGKTVCLVGCGNVGTECAKKFNAFGCTVYGVDLYPRIDENYQVIYPLSQLGTALVDADVVVLTLPLTNETHYLFNAERLALLKKDAVLVNIARGGVVDTSALVEALQTKLLGAVLDVFEEEPLPKNNPLWQMENAIITPHNSFVGEGNSERLFEVITKNLSVV